MNLKINHRLGVENVKFFNSFDLTLKYDSVGSTFGIDFFFDPKNQTQAELACVSHFHEVIVQHNSETLITGFILNEKFKRASKKQLSKLQGYSKPGILEDCNIPPSIFPLQSNGLSLAQIAKKLCDPFKIKVVVDSSVSSEMNRVIKSFTAEPTSTIKDILAEQATQLNVIITHNEKGELLFTRAKTNSAPIFTIDPDDEDSIPALDIDLEFNGQEIFKYITVMKQADDGGGNAGEYTIENPYCPIIPRYKTIIQSTGDDVSTKKAAQNALAAQLKNIPLVIELDRWDINGKIIRPNSIISVRSPENFIYNKTNWFIEQVQYKGDEKATTATLTCVPPEVYNNQTPKNIFVDVHKNFPRI